jgi:predicted NACHT family NTPase
MTIRSHLSTAQEEIRKALVLALETKRDHIVSELFDTLNKIKSTTTKVYEIAPVKSNQDFWGTDGISITGNPGAISSDTISFGAAQPVSTFSVGTSGADVISFS